MAHKDLQAFLGELEKAGELIRIKDSISHELEISEITQRVSKAHGPALLFENVPGHDMPVLTGAFGSLKRMSIALGVSDLDILGPEVLDFLDVMSPDSLFNRLRLINKARWAANIEPKITTKAPCQEIVFQGDEVDLSRIPVLKAWPQDGGPAITLPLVFTRHPETGLRNVGMYRLQVYSRNTTGMHWYGGTGGASHYQVAEKSGKNLEVAVAIGPDPAMTYAATAPLPDGIDEVFFAGFLRKEPVELVKCKTVNLEVPASSQIILEGFVRPHERRMEGPFGNHTGYYSPAGEYPVFHVQCITMRKDAIYPATVVGPPPQEDCYLAKATERLFLPLLKRFIPEIVDINQPLEGIFHNFAFVSIDKKYPGQARKVINGLWGFGHLKRCKVICVFDKDVNVKDLSEVLWRLGNNIDPERDVFFTKGPVAFLNPGISPSGYGSKMGIDCTRKLWGEGLEAKWPEDMKGCEEVRKKIDGIWRKLGLE